jgi:hypothetical protein
LWGIQSLLLYGGLYLDDAEVRLETPAPGRRRVDIELGEKSSSARRTRASATSATRATEELAGYVRDRTAELGHRYAGILTDKQEWIRNAAAAG